MKNYVNNIIKYCLLTFILILFIINVDIIIDSVYYACILFFTKLFISIFPFIILSNILIYYDYHIFLKKIFGNLFSKLFRINPNNSIVIILSMLTSQPNNSIYLKNINNNETESNNILAFTYFPSIAFVIGTIGIKYYNSFKIGLFLLLNNYLCNFAIGIFLRNKNNKVNNTNIEIKKETSLINTIKHSIESGINTSFIILGNICIFMILINLINNYFNINPNILSIISGLLELTSGINLIFNLNICLKIKLFLTSFILNFSGLCIIIQSICILNRKINIKKILIIKLVFSLIFSILFIVLYMV